MPAAASLTLLILGLLLVLSYGRSTVPNVQNLTIIATGSMLIGGALAVAWAEKKLFSERAYQYNTMRSLFENAERRIRHQIDALAELAAQHPDAVVESDPLEEDFREDYRQQLRIIQDMIRDLGLEALDENAEWLILHRARPLEPVMAG